MEIHTPPMTFIDDDAASVWAIGIENNKDPYGKAIYSYTSEWATRMEVLINSGSSIETIAKQTSHDADDERITGFMYGAAVSILSGCWKYVEELRIWHNLDIQLSNEGEKANEDGTILNPALLSIGKK